MTQTEKRTYLIKYLSQEQPRYADMPIPVEEQEQKKLLRSLSWMYRQCDPFRRRNTAPLGVFPHDGKAKNRRTYGRSKNHKGLQSPLPLRSSHSRPDYPRGRYRTGLRPAIELLPLLLLIVIYI